MRHIRVLQRNIRAHCLRKSTVLSIRRRQLRLYEEEQAKAQRGKQPKQTSKAARERKAAFEEQVAQKKLKQQLKQLGYKLSVYREELLEWSEEKKEFDEIEEARRTVMAGTGHAEDKKNRKVFRRPPTKPHLPIALPAEDLKRFHQEVSRLERTAHKVKEEAKAESEDVQRTLEEMAGVK